MSSNKIAYSKNGAPLTDAPHYRLAKGGSAKPNAVGTCDITVANDGKGNGLQNYFVLAHMQPVARVQSRHRVSPSPRKIPNYEMDILVETALRKLPTPMGEAAHMLVHQQRAMIRQSLPRFR